MKIAPGGIQWIITVTTIFIIIFSTIFFLNGFYQNISMFFSGLFLILIILLMIFFRDPERQIGECITAVADGRIQEIIDYKQNSISWIRISTFMNIHNVHVNRMPLDGEIRKLTHIPGGYIPTFKKESDRNERLEVIVKTKIGNIKIILIAGTLARRIVPYIKQGDVISKGTRISLIRLGSRVDLYLPKSSVDIKISVNDRIQAGVDTIASIND
jgi:phosphatidylserine decarboxylase